MVKLKAVLWWLMIGAFTVVFLFMCLFPLVVECGAFAVW